MSSSYELGAVPRCEHVGPRLDQRQRYDHKGVTAALQRRRNDHDDVGQSSAKPTQHRAKNRRNIGRKSTKIHPKFDPKAVQERPKSQDAPKPARPPPDEAAKSGQEPSKERPRAAKSGQVRPKSDQEPSESAPEPSQDAPRPCQEAVRARVVRRASFEHVFGSIFRRFRLVARKLRCASRTSFYSVLLPSHEVSFERVRAASNLENRRVSPSKIEAGAVRATQHRARAASFERQSAREVPSGPPKN